MEKALHTLIDACHDDAVEAGFWEGARGPATADGAALALLGDLVVAVGRLADRQRKGGRIDAALIAPIEQTLHTLRQYARHGAIAPYARVNPDGAGREERAIPPPSGLAEQLLRQLIHLTIEAGEAIEAYRAHGYRDAPIVAEEVADAGIVWFDLCGAFPGVVAAFLRKRERNRLRGRRYGRAAPAKMLDGDEQIAAGGFSPPTARAIIEGLMHND